jgi:hypothetical protein
MGADVADSLLCVCWVWPMLLRQRSSASATARGWTAERVVSSADSWAGCGRVDGGRVDRQGMYPGVANQ